MARLGVGFEITPAFIDEAAVVLSADTGGAPERHVTVLARAKMECVMGKTKGDCAVIAADTIIHHNGKIVEKPIDKSDALNMIKALQGNTHNVYTGVSLAVRRGGEVLTECFCETATVRIRPLKDAEIDFYVNSGEPMGRSGGYAINGLGAMMIDRVEGDFNAVVGLPLARVCAVLERLGVDLFRQAPQTPRK
jgi:septum formation protein